jgi:UDP-glucose 4-epimerase
MHVMSLVSELRGKRVIITGANGFIGYHLTKRLISEGARVDAFIHERDNRIKRLKDHCSIDRVSLLDKDNLESLIKEIKPEIVFHLAGVVNVDRSPSLISDMMNINFQGTVNLIHALRGIDYEYLINTGTCEEYGVNPAPFSEEQCPRPVSPYSVSKASTTLYCTMLADTQKLPIVTLRPFLTYGPFQISRMLVPDTIMKALKKEDFKMTKGEQTREFNFVDDIVEGYLRAAVTPEARGEVLNIGNGKEYTVREVVLLILELLDNPVNPLIGALPYRGGETWRFYCDNSKAHRILNWSPRIELKEGLRRTIDWFLNNRDEWRS